MQTRPAPVNRATRRAYYKGAVCFHRRTRIPGGVWTKVGGMLEDLAARHGMRIRDRWPITLKA